MSAAVTVKNRSKVTTWQRASWDDYGCDRDRLPADQYRLFFHQGYLHNHRIITATGWEGINHATICDLFTAILYVWFSIHPEQMASALQWK